MAMLTHAGSLLFASLLFTSELAAATLPTDTLERRRFVGTSAFMLGNLFPDPPSFYQLNAGYWLDRKNVLSVEAITWDYGAPLGIPYGDDHGDPALNYPGRVRAWGLGLAYQHYWWRGWYTAAHALSFLQRYRGLGGEHLGQGYQLYLILRTGYHITFGGGRFFAEPSLALTYWPVETNRPAPFAQQDAKWNNYFVPEPGLHIGYRF